VRRMMSMDSSGLERVHMAQTTSFR
jgi:hypothetical protein